MLLRLLLTLCIVALVQSSSAEQSSIPAYDRGEFGRWIDSDSDCQNTRHELLATLSTGPLLYSDNGCRVLRGRWIDPYTNVVFISSSDLDVDHAGGFAYSRINDLTFLRYDRRSLRPVSSCMAQPHYPPFHLT